jgi:elongation factor P--beta-lysine ligase
MEIANGYEDEDDLTDKTTRSQSVSLYNYEEATITELLKEKPQQGALIGFGFDRLCMVVADNNDISNFIFANNFSFLHK